MRHVSKGVISVGTIGAPGESSGGAKPRSAQAHGDLGKRKRVDLRPPMLSRCRRQGRGERAGRDDVAGPQWLSAMARHLADEVAESLDRAAKDLRSPTGG